MESTVAVILGGGMGTRLFPLTKERSKPAVPLAGKYRLIDIPVSNCINSNLRKIYVLTMFQSASLNSHLASAYRFDAFSKGFVQVIAAEQTYSGGNWFQGTADAVRQSWRHIGDGSERHVLILSGDHLYRMDYEEFARVHEQAKADISIAVKPVTREEAGEFGILKIDSAGRIVKFVEKPRTAEALADMAADTTVVGLSKEEAQRRPYLASMGIYYFSTKVLARVLAVDPANVDFGKHVIPKALSDYKVQAYCFDGYWADIGTVKAFYEANMQLVSPLPAFNLFDPARPIYTNARYLPGAKVTRASVEGSILCEGSIVEGGTVRDSILGVRSRVRPGATIENAIVMGADSYQAEGPGDATHPFIGVSEGAYVRRAIIDKDASIGRGAQLVNRGNVWHHDDPEGRFHVREGIICVPKGAEIPDGFVF